MDISARLRALLASHCVTQVEIANALHVATSYVNAVVNGKKKLPIDTLEAICDYLGISMSEFFKPFSPEETVPQHLKTLYMETCDLKEDEIEPLLSMVAWMRKHRTERDNRVNLDPKARKGTGEHCLPVSGAAAAGSPLYDEASGEDAVPVPPRYLNRDRYFIVQARGQSMMPRINDGDYVVVEKEAMPESGEIALVRVDGVAFDEYAIKRFYVRGDRVELRSFNPDFSPMFYPLEELKSAEKVVHIISRSVSKS